MVSLCIICVYFSNHQQYRSFQQYNFSRAYESQVSQGIAQFHWVMAPYSRGYWNGGFFIKWHNWMRGRIPGVRPDFIFTVWSGVNCLSSLSFPVVLNEMSNSYLFQQHAFFLPRNLVRLSLFHSRIGQAILKTDKWGYPFHDVISMIKLGHHS